MWLRKIGNLIEDCLVVWLDTLTANLNRLHDESRRTELARDYYKDVYEECMRNRN